MNKFNRKGNAHKNVKNNVKEKWRLKSEGRRDRAAARAMAKAAAQGTVVVPKGKAERLSVSGRRTGKHERKVVRKWQKSRVAAVESGAVSMEDIVMYAAASSERKKNAKSSGEDKEVKDTPVQTAGGGNSSGASKVGFRVKPSKKARLRLKRRSGGVGGSAAAATAADGMEE